MVSEDRDTRIRYLRKCFFGAVIIISMAGCATIDGGYHAADKVASEGRLEKGYVKTGLCTLTTFRRFSSPGDPITIYIEGDGAAWKSRNELSLDPTPRHSVVLELAVIDPAKNVAYLARPGQLTAAGSPDCGDAYWSGKRFSKDAVDAMNSAIDIIKSKSRSKEINLIGYSGGASIAVIIAAQRNDIASLRTIAGNLDSEAINRYHRVTPLGSSLNPVDFAIRISHIPQRHFVAANDLTIPISITRSFVEKIGDKNSESITIVKGVNHHYGWQKRWASLLRLPLYNNTNSN